MALTVNMKHQAFGEFQILNVTEIHFCYPSPMGKRIAFESDIEGDGVTYDLADVIEFEAVEQGLHPTSEPPPASDVLITPENLPAPVVRLIPLSINTGEKHEHETTNQKHGIQRSGTGS